MFRNHIDVVLRRNNLDIYADILNAARGGAKKTHIVYKANLNFKIVKKYLKSLREKELIQNCDNGYYVTTPKGIQFLEKYEELIRPILAR